MGQALRRLASPSYTLAVYCNQLNHYLQKTWRCNKRVTCERCTSGLGVCDFDEVVRRCVDAFIHDRFDPFAKPNLVQIQAFLPGYNPAVARQGGSPAKDFYGELCRDGHLDAAGHRVARAAEVRRTEGGRG